MRSAVHAQLVGKLAPLLVQVQEEEALPHQLLDVLWHYECVVSPGRSSPASKPLSPISHATAAGEGGLAASKPLSSPTHATAASALASATASASCLGSGVDLRSILQEPSFQKDDVERQALQRVFNTFDENGDGRVSIQELEKIFERLGISKTQESIESLLASLVIKVQGHVDEEEFVLLYESACCEQVEGSTSDLHADVDRDLRAAFQVFDKDHNGFISPEELQSVLCSLGFPQAKELEACVEMIARVDENGDGQVDFVEFKKLLGFADPFMILSCTS